MLKGSILIHENSLLGLDWLLDRTASPIAWWLCLLSLGAFGSSLIQSSTMPGPEKKVPLPMALLIPTWSISSSTFRLCKEQLGFLLISVGDVPTGNASWYIFLIKSQWLMVTLKPIFGIKSFDIHQLYLRNWYYFLWWFLRCASSPRSFGQLLLRFCSVASWGNTWQIFSQLAAYHLFCCELLTFTYIYICTYIHNTYMHIHTHTYNIQHTFIHSYIHSYIPQIP